MINTNVRESATEQRAVSEVRLWQAVLISAIQEWKSGPVRLKSQAEHYLFQDEKDFPLVCHLAGMDVVRLHAKLTKLRGQVSHDLPDRGLTARDLLSRLERGLERFGDTEILYWCRMVGLL
jgi:hypothetical protein